MSWLHLRQLYKLPADSCKIVSLQMYFWSTFSSKSTFHRCIHCIGGKAKKVIGANAFISLLIKCIFHIAILQPIPLPIKLFFYSFHSLLLTNPLYEKVRRLSNITIQALDVLFMPSSWQIRGTKKFCAVAKYICQLFSDSGFNLLHFTLSMWLLCGD